MKSFSRVTQILLFILVVLIPFSVRHVFETSWNYQTGAYSDFTSLSLYISDLVLLLLIASILIFKRSWSLPKTWKISALLTVTWLILEFFMQSKGLLPLQAYFSARIVLLLIFAVVVAQIRVSREKLAWLFSLLGAIQGLIATIQFYTQKSIGLYLLGESHLGPDTLGVAKIVSHGTKLIRGYGTFPHANLLGAFLIVSSLFNLYLLTKTPQSPRDKISPREIILYITLFLNVFGVFLSFSRAGILALVVSGVVSGTYLLYIKGFWSVSRGIMAFIASGLISIAILFPYLNTRATISDNATKERAFYNQVGQKIVKDKPFFGTGPGTSVLHMKQYTENELKPWEIQPIHNYYLISWAEWGIGAILLLFLIIYPLITLIRTKKDTWNIILVSLGASFLVLFLLDHYFYTIWPTQLLLWLIIGLSLGNISHETIYDTASE